MVGASLRLASRQESFQDSRVGALTSEGGSVCSLGSTGGGYCVWHLIKIEEQHSTVIPSDSHSGIYFPPGRPLWQSADDQMIQTIRPEACGDSFPTKRTLNICMFLLFKH